ncbi:MAG: hypothetical protein AAF183_15805 [Pseudomonadota bacterium]
MLGPTDTMAMLGGFDETLLAGLVVIAAALGGAAAGWLVSLADASKVSTAALEHMSLRLTEQGSVIGRVEASGLSQIELLETERTRIRAQLLDVAGIVQRLASAQRGAEAVTEKTSKALVRRVRLSVEDISNRLAAIENRLDALDARCRSREAPASPSTPPSGTVVEDPAPPPDLALAKASVDEPGPAEAFPVPDAPEDMMGLSDDLDRRLEEEEALLRDQMSVSLETADQDTAVHENHVKDLTLTELPPRVIGLITA